MKKCKMPPNGFAPPPKLYSTWKWFVASDDPKAEWSIYTAMRGLELGTVVTSYQDDARRGLWFAAKAQIA